MSERPETLQLLKEGKLLASSVFPALVETWNWLVEAFDGIKGDYDLNPKEGYITVDKRDPAHPVIRLAKPVKAEDGSGEQLQAFNSNFQFKDGSILSGVVCIARQYYLVDGLSPAEGESRISDGEYRLKFTLNNSTKQWVIVVEKGSGFAAPNDTTSYAPLFSIYDGEVAADYRNTVYLYARE